MIKKIIDKFFSIKTDTKESSAIGGNSITFFIDLEKDSEPNVKISITDTTEQGCKKFSELLFDLNSGEYHKSILDLLINMGKQDDQIQKFVETSVLYWSYLLHAKNTEYKYNKTNFWKENKPLIMPTDFNKNAK